MASISETRRLMELTCARLCHELSGLAGTLAGVIDLAAEEAPAAAESLSVGRDAASELIQRLKLLRAAWGPDGGPDGAPMALVDLLSLARGRPNAHRVAIDASALPPDTVFNPPAGRLALNILLLASECLPRGGTVSLLGSAADLFVAIAGPQAAWPSGFAGCLANEAAAVAALTDARAVQMPLTAVLSHALGLRLSILIAVAPGAGAPPLRLQSA
jgi:histidine phosphotransferase ChpT